MFFGFAGVVACGILAAMQLLGTWSNRSPFGGSSVQTDDVHAVSNVDLSPERWAAERQEDAKVVLAEDSRKVRRSLYDRIRFPRAPEDVSRFGCRDMAGNGRKWTRTWDSADGQVGTELPIPNAGPDHFIAVRGKSFTAVKPFLFSDLPSGEFYFERGGQGELRLTTRPDLAFSVVFDVSW